MIDRFGYLGSAADGAAALLTGKGVTAALKQFQRFAQYYVYYYIYYICSGLGVSI